MINPWVGIVAVIVALGLLMGAVRVAQSRLRLGPELSRKLVHVGMGLVALGFPWIFDRAWPVVTMAAVSAAGLLAVKIVKPLRATIGSVLLGVQRDSLGEIYFPIAVATLYTLSLGRWELYFIPMLILTLADALAALIGVRYGTLNYTTLDGQKSAEGSFAFFTAAMLSTLVPLLLGTQTGRAETLLISLILGLLAMLIEAVAWRGLDNLLIPLGAFAFLRLYLPMTVGSLVMRLALTVALLIFALSWRRRSTLDDSSLIAAALFAYAAVLLGGLAWVVAPLALFLLQAIVWPMRSDESNHDIFVLLCVTGTGLLWLFISVVAPKPGWIVPYSVSFAAHIAFVAITQNTREPISSRVAARLGGAISLGVLLGLTPVAVVLTMAPEPAFASRASLAIALELAVVIAGVGLPACAFFVLLPRLYGRLRRPYAVHITAGLLSFAGSCLVAVLVVSS